MEAERIVGWMERSREEFPQETPDALMRGRSRDSVQETDEGGSGAQTRRIRG